MILNKNFFLKDFIKRFIKLSFHVRLYRVKYFSDLLKKPLRVRIKRPITEGLQPHCLLLACPRTPFLSFFLSFCLSFSCRQRTADAFWMIRCISHSRIVKLEVLPLRLSSGIMGLVCGISGPEEGVVHDYQVLHMNSWPCGPLNSEHERGGISTPSQLDSFHFPATFMIGQWEEHNVEMGRYYIKRCTNIAQRIPTDGHHAFFFFFYVCLVIGFDL